MAFHAACVSCVPAFYPFSLHKVVSYTFKLPKELLGRPEKKAAFSLQRGEAIFLPPLQNRNSNT